VGIRKIGKEEKGFGFFWFWFFGFCATGKMNTAFWGFF